MIKSEIGKVVYPQWIETARLSLNKKNFNIFINILVDVISYNEIPDTYDQNTKAYKLFKTLQICEHINSKLKKYERKCNQNVTRMKQNWNENESQNTDKQNHNLGKLETRNKNKEKNKEIEEKSKGVFSSGDCFDIDEVN